MQLYMRYEGSEVLYPAGVIARVQLNRRLASACQRCRLRRLALRFTTALHQAEDGY
jgi:hypothetical protein